MIHIRNKNLYIREINNSDLSILHLWRNSDDFIRFCTKRKTKISFIDFGYEINRDLKQDRLIQVVVFLHNICIGTLYTYRFDEVNKTLYLTAYFSSEYNYHITIIKSSMLFILVLFKLFELSSLYVEVYSYNKKVIEMLENIGFEHKDCVSRCGVESEEKYDLHVLSLSKEKIKNQKNKKLIQRLT